MGRIVNPTRVLKEENSQGQEGTCRTAAATVTNVELLRASSTDHAQTAVVISL
jgi:hypothetical protein